MCGLSAGCGCIESCRHILRGAVYEPVCVCHGHREVRKAVAYHKRILGMDPNNARAEEALARIAKSVMNAVDKMKTERDKDDKDLK